MCSAKSQKHFYIPMFHAILDGVSQGKKLRRYVNQGATLTKKTTSINQGIFKAKTMGRLYTVHPKQCVGKYSGPCVKNVCSQFAKALLYNDIPCNFTFNKLEKKWEPSK